MQGVLKDLVAVREELEPLLEDPGKIHIHRYRYIYIYIVCVCVCVCIHMYILTHTHKHTDRLLGRSTRRRSTRHRHRWLMYT